MQTGRHAHTTTTNRNHKHAVLSPAVLSTGSKEKAIRRHSAGAQTPTNSQLNTRTHRKCRAEVLDAFGADIVAFEFQRLQGLVHLHTATHTQSVLSMVTGCKKVEKGLRSGGSTCTKKAQRNHKQVPWAPQNTAQAAQRQCDNLGGWG